MKKNIVIGIALACSIITPCFATDGALDTTFNPIGTFPGVPGVETIPLTNFGGSATSAVVGAVALQTNGNIVIAGHANPTGGDESMSIARLIAANGALDGTFGTGGIFTIPISSFGSGTNVAVANGVAIQTDSNIVVAGVANPTFAGGTSMSIARVTTNGALDNTFGTDGILTITLTAFGAGTTSALVEGLVLQTNGDIVVAGTADPGGAVDTFAIARLTPTGALDGTFGTGGITTIPLASFGSGTNAANANAVAIQSNGAILITGEANPTSAGGNSMAIVRLTSAGVLDSTFGTGGTVTIPLSSFGSGVSFAAPFTIAVQPNGNIVLGGLVNISGSAVMGFARVTTTGALDSTFGTNGTVTIPAASFGSGTTNTQANDLMVQSNGNIIAAGLANPNATGGGTSMSIVRLTPAGVLDSTFGTGGIVTLPLTDYGTGTNNAIAQALAIQSNSFIVAAGLANPTAAGGASMSIIRLTSSATPAAPILTTATANSAGIVTVTGKGANDGATITIIANGSTPIGTGTADSFGNFSFSATTPLVPGSYSITVTQTVASLTSPQSNAIIVTIPGTAITSSTAPTLIRAILTPVGTVTVTGFNATPGATISIVLNGSAIIGTGTADQLGNFVFTSSAVLPHGLDVISVTQSGSLADQSNKLLVAVGVPLPSLFIIRLIEKDFGQ